MTTISTAASATQALAARGVAYAPQIARAASKYGLDPRLLAAVAAQETGGPGSSAGRNVVGDGGHGHGIFQIDDRWHRFAATPQAMDPQQNADYAAGMLSGLLHRYHGDVHKALSAYNAGDPGATGTLTTWQDGRRLGYADSVLRHYAVLGGNTPETLAQSLCAESPSEVAALSPLPSFASMQLPAFQPAAPQSSHSWRRMAGIDRSGHQSHGADVASLIYSGDASSE